MISQDELNEVVTDSLRKLGASRQETLLYCLSLKLGPTSIAVLASQIGISRPQAYKIISELEKRGLANFSSRKRFARTFIVEPPSKLQELLRKHQEAVAEADKHLAWAMPDLLAAYQQGSLPASVRILQGKEQFLKVFFQCVEEAANKEILVMGSAQDFIAFVSWAEERRWIDARVRLNVHLRALLFPSGDTNTLATADAKELRETRILRDMEPFSTLIMVYANKTILWQPNAPMAIQIEDNYITAMMRSVYDVMWRRAISS
ncbi:MAG: helix-turn-helix domain-containing protein [Patescibacteria group bacterium]|nr:helix-turn-helix domain-containing protein [Patescibacteria group bacterium]